MPYVASLAAFTLLYFAAGRFGLSLAAMHASVSLVWPPTGLALAALLLFGPRLWPGVALGAFLVNALTSAPLWTAPFIAAGNTLEAVCGASLLRRVGGFRNSLERFQDVLGLVVLGAGLSTMVSATIGVTSLCLAGAAPWALYVPLWWQWWLGDAMGALLLAPVLLTWRTQPRITWRPRQAIEAGALLLLVVAATQIAFGGWFPVSITKLPSIYVFPFVIWAGLRFDARVVATVTLVVSATAIWTTLGGSSPFRGETLTESLTLLQVFMSGVAVTGLALAAAMAQRRQAGEALRGSETRLAGILNSAMDAIVSVDAQQRIVLFNRAAEQMFGWKASEVLNQPLDRLLPARFREVHRGHIAQFGQTGVTTRSMRSPGDLVALRADGREIPIEATISQAAVDGQKVYTVILRDITERKQAEAERRVLLSREQAARAGAEAANRVKDEFLATTSHELRAPLNTILMWVQLLRHGTLDAAAAAGALETVERNTKAQAQIIADLLDVSRIISGKLGLEMRRVDLAPVIEAALDVVRPAARAKAIRLERILDPSAGPLVGDPDRLQQVVWNLLSNAVKFTPRGGRVDVRLDRVGSRARLTVTDTGQGIPPDFLPYVFERFRQADPSTTRAHGGLGLGLAIVRHLVEMHGGTVQAKSPGQGQGATFIVEFPLMPVHPEGAEREGAGPAEGGPRLADRPGLDGVTVLVVDDEGDAREVLAVVLRRYGAEVVAAASVPEAIAAVERRRPDVLVSDIGMPGEDGYALIQRVRALGEERGGGVPAVALTGYAREDDRERVLSAGYQAHVAKPVAPAKLVAIVADLVRRGRKWTPGR